MANMAMKTGSWYRVTYRRVNGRANDEVVAQFLGVQADGETRAFSLRPLAGTFTLLTGNIVAVEPAAEAKPRLPIRSTWRG